LRRKKWIEQKNEISEQVKFQNETNYTRKSWNWKTEKNKKMWDFDKSNKMLGKLSKTIDIET